MTRTYVDAGVFIAIVRGGQTPLAPRAVALLEDQNRSFCTSVFLRLELLPQAMYHRNATEISFYEDFFTGVRDWATSDASLFAIAERVAARHGLHALDALHVAAAIALDADELVTTEGLNKPIHRVREVRVVSL